MKKLNLFFILAVTLCITAGCEKDNRNGGSLKIEAKVVNGNDYNNLIDEVRVITTHIFYPWYEVQPTEIVTCKYNNGGFTLTLPKKIIESAYTFIRDGQTSMTASIHANFYAYKNNECVGEFAYCSLDSNYVVRYFYAFKDGDEPISFFEHLSGIVLKFKKGWNTVYFSKYTQYGYDPHSEKPNVELNWYFIPN